MSGGGTEAEGALPGARPAAESEETVPKATLASDITCKFRDFLELPPVSKVHWKGLQNSLKFVILRAMVYYRETQNQPKKDTRDGVQGFPNARLPLSSGGDSLPTLMCDNTHELLPTRETPPSFDVLKFYWGLLYVGA